MATVNSRSTQMMTKNNRINVQWFSMWLLFCQSKEVSCLVSSQRGPLTRFRAQTHTYAHTNVLSVWTGLLLRRTAIVTVRHLQCFWTFIDDQYRLRIQTAIRIDFSEVNYNLRSCSWHLLAIHQAWGSQAQVLQSPRTRIIEGFTPHIPSNCSSPCSFLCYYLGLHVSRQSSWLARHHLRYIKTKVFMYLRVKQVIFHHIQRHIHILTSSPNSA